MKSKVCPCCGKELPLSEYYRVDRRKPSNRKNHPDGRSTYCIECSRKMKNEEYNRSRKVPDGLRRNRGGAIVEKRGKIIRLYWGELKTQDFRRKFPFSTNEDLAIDFECSIRTIVRRAREMGLKKDADWLRRKWDVNRKQAQFMNTLASTPKADLTNFIEGGKRYRFQPGHGNCMTKEERSEVMKRAWVTRKRNQREKMRIHNLEL